MPRLFSVLAAVLPVLAADPATAHFQELIPDPPIVSQSGDAVSLSLTFTHPMAGGPAMPMGRPRRFGVLVNAEPHDLTDRLRPARVDGAAAYTATYAPRRMGDHVFYLSPAPYWEPAEGRLIVHHTKVVVDAFGAGGGWDALVGLPVEIEPLTRPYGLWTGTLFRGIVRRDGEPVPFAEVEIEYRNDGGVSPPSPAFVTQVVKADARGVFSYVMPRAGWWGFAALVEADSPRPGPDGTPVPVELGGLIWVNVRDMD